MISFFARTADISGMMAADSAPAGGFSWLTVIAVVSFVFSIVSCGPIIYGVILALRGRRRRAAAGFDRKSELRVDVIRSNERGGEVFPSITSRPGELGQWGTLHPRGVRVPRPTTGIGQVIGALASGRFVGALYPRKLVGVFISPEDFTLDSVGTSQNESSPSFHFYFSDSEHIIIGGFERNLAAIRFKDELRAHFGSDVLLWRTDQPAESPENTVDIGIPWITRAKLHRFSRRRPRNLNEYEIVNGVLGPSKFPPSADYGLVIFWRNPDQEDSFRRVILCVGGSSYGTGDSVRFVFDNLLLGSVGSSLRMVRTSRRVMRSILSELRRHTNCVFVLLAFEYGDLRQLAEPWTGRAKTGRVVSFAVLDEGKDAQKFNQRPTAMSSVSLQEPAAPYTEAAD